MRIIICTLVMILSLTAYAYQAMPQATVYSVAAKEINNRPIAVFLLKYYRTIPAESVITISDDHDGFLTPFSSSRLLSALKKLKRQQIIEFTASKAEVITDESDKAYNSPQKAIWIKGVYFNKGCAAFTTAAEKTGLTTKQTSTLIPLGCPAG